jgi:hypothetical protein
MGLTKRALLSSLTVAIFAIGPATAAVAKPSGRPVRGTRTATTVLDLTTGAATTTSSGDLAHLGAYTAQSTEQFIAGAPPTFSFVGAVTLTAANGDKVFATVTGSGAFTSATTQTSTDTFTITGGTGRFDGATGTLTEAISGTVDGVSGTIQTSHEDSTITGEISY